MKICMLGDAQHVEEVTISFCSQTVCWMYT
jgi:hypothetical protein